MTSWFGKSNSAPLQPTGVSTISPVNPDGSTAANLRSASDSSVALGTEQITQKLLLQGWELSSEANSIVHESTNKLFLVRLNPEKGNQLWIAFASTADWEAYASDSKFGEVQITDLKAEVTTFFGCGFKGFVDNSNKPVCVLKGMLQWFLNIMTHEHLSKEIEKAREEEKQIIFSGHSWGGAIAVLATLWLLNQQKRGSIARQGSGQNGRRTWPPSCLTFGAPLVGDSKLVEAVGRESWTSQFCHLVSPHDIVPRMLLAPLESLKQPVSTLLPFWQKLISNAELRAVAVLDITSGDPVANVTGREVGAQEGASHLPNPLNKTEIDALLTTLRFSFMSMAKSLIGGSRSVFRSSPYRPLGVFILCQETGAACLDSPFEVLQWLSQALEEHDKGSITDSSVWTRGHVEYGELMREMGEKNAPGTWEKMQGLPDSHSSSHVPSSFQLSMNMHQVNNWFTVVNQVAKENERRVAMNSAGRNSAYQKVQHAMVEIDYYIFGCQEENKHYYDVYKEGRSQREKNVSNMRQLLANFWDETMELLKKKQLPDDFQVQRKWIYAGHSYRLLVEPLDIANYYRKEKHYDSGHYRMNGRPSRYRILQQWYEVKMGDPIERQKLPLVTQDSQIWAWFEEAQEALDVLDVRLRKLQVDMEDQFTELNMNNEETYDTYYDTMSIPDKVLREPKIVAAMITLENFEKHVVDKHKNMELSKDLISKGSSWVKWWHEYRQVKKTFNIPGDTSSKFLQDIDATYWDGQPQRDPELDF